VTSDPPANPAEAQKEANHRIHREKTRSDAPRPLNRIAMKLEAANSEKCQHCDDRERKTSQPIEHLLRAGERFPLVQQGMEHTRCAIFAHIEY
jgi:hypothetical protein